MFRNFCLKVLVKSIHQPEQERSNKASLSYMYHRSWWNGQDAILYLVHRIIKSVQKNLYANQLDEQLYKYLVDKWENRSKKQTQTSIECLEDLDDVVSLNDVEEAIQNLIIFDDTIVGKNHERVKDLFIRGRKRNCSIIFIFQSYYVIPHYSLKPQ